MRRLELTIDVVKANWVSENGAHGSPYVLARKRRNLKELGYLRALNTLRGMDRCSGGVWFEYAHVTAFVQYPSNNRADPTNAGPTVKPIIDGFTRAGLWADDDSTHVLGPDFRREPGVTGVRGLHRIRFLIEDASAMTGNDESGRV